MVYTIMQIENKNSLSFKSNIRFLPKAEFDRINLPRPLSYVREMSCLKDVQEVISSGETGGIKFCIGGILKLLDKNKNYIFHWYPTELFGSYKPFLQIKTKDFTEIMCKIKELKELHKLKGFMIGGLSESCDEELAQSSMKLLNHLKRPFEQKTRENFTLFFAQKAIKSEGKYPESAFAYSVSDDTYFVNSGVYEDYNERFFHEHLSNESIKDNFKFIHIAPDDKVFIGLDSQEQIPNDFWNKNEFILNKN